MNGRIFRAARHGVAFDFVEDISMYRLECLDEAIETLDLLQKQGFPMSQNGTHYLLQGCTAKKDLQAGRQVHSLLVSRGLDSAAVTGDHLIRLFACCGSLLEADIAFSRVIEPTVYTWHAIISAHATYGESEKAVEMYQKMQQDGLMMNKFIFSCVIKACGSLGAIEQGRLVHEEIVRSRLQSDLVVGSSLIHLYSKCGCLEEAHIVFDELPDRNVVSWVALIAGYTHHGNSLLALQLFEKMQQEHIKPNKVILLCISKACGDISSLEHAKLIQVEVSRCGLESDVDVGNAIIEMHVKCGNLIEARRVFDDLPSPDVASWATLISGYVLHEDCVHALNLFERMQQEGFEATKAIFLCTLKACSSIGASSKGKIIHNWIVRSDFSLDIALGNTLVDMYAKCESLQDARKMFDSLQNRNVVSYGAMISGYAQLGYGFQGLELFEKMQLEGIRPNKFIFPCILKVFSSVGAIEQGKLIHDQIIWSGFDSDVVIGNTLVDMYAKCGATEEAATVFDCLSHRDIVSWSAMVTGFAQNEDGLYALKFFEMMQDEGLHPNKVTFLSALKACGSVATSVQGKQIHEEIIKYGLESDVVVSNTLIDMYSKCGSLELAREVFDKMPNWDVVSWSVMIAGYAQNDQGFPALELFERMEKEGLKPSKFIYPCVLKACGSIGALEIGKVVHNEITKVGLGSDIIVGSTLVDMYAKCGSLEEATEVFRGLINRNEVSWGAMIGGYVQHGHGCLALDSFEEMEQLGMSPDSATLLCILKACGSIGALHQGRVIHDQIVRSGGFSDNVLGSSLVDMYTRCGSLGDAHKVFDELSEPDVVLWGAMIAGYAQHGMGSSALKLFEKMRQDGVKPNKVIYLCVLKACCSMEIIGQGKLLHDHIVKVGLESDVVVGNTIVDMYAKCGNLEEANKVFDVLSNRDGVSWGAMITGFAQHGHGRPALELFEKMQQEGINPNKATFLCILKSCGSIGALMQGKLIHQEIIKSGLELDVVLGNTLVDMYAKCGSLEDAHGVFDKLTNRDEVSWSAMIAGCAQHGNYRLAGLCLEDMHQEGLKPHSTIYTSVISAFSHAGQLEEGYRHFTSMIEDYMVTPNIEHFNCMVDLLGRAGCLKQAEQFLLAMPIPADTVGWMSLLASCKTYGNVEIGRRCFDQVVQLDPNLASGYTLMSSIYADAHMREEVLKVQELRKGISAWRKPGKAWIEFDNNFFEFLVGDKTHPQFDKICGYFDGRRILMKEEGYVPLVDLIMQSTSDEDEYTACEPSEKLAAFDLCTRFESVTGSVTKNLTMCIGSQNAIKFPSNISIAVSNEHGFQDFEDREYNTFAREWER